MKGKDKAFPLQVWSGPKVSRKLRFPNFMTTAQDGVKVVSLTHRPPLPPRNTPGTHFFYRLIRPQGHSATGRVISRISVSIQPLGQFGQESKPTQGTCMAVVRCILDKFLGVVCHCFPPTFRRSHFRRQVTPRPGKIMSLKNSNETVGNRTRDLPVCNVVP